MASTLPVAALSAEDFRLSTSIGYRADADIDGGGDFNETRFSLTGSKAFNPNERLRLDPIVSYRFSAYDFSSAEPWEDVHGLRATFLARYALDGKWAVFGGPSIGIAAESGADLGDSFVYGGALGVSYSVSEMLTVGGGLTFSSEIEDEARVRPILILNWRINDRWTVESGYTEVAGAGGPGGEITYKINDQWSVGGGMQFQEKRFRLSDDGPVRDGVGEDTSLPIYAKVIWQACPNAAFELVGGVAAWGELRLENRHGHKIAETDYDPAPLIGLRALFSF